MDTQGVKQRHTAMPASNPVEEATASGSNKEMLIDDHPAGEVRHGGLIQIIRLLSFVTYFLGSCTTILATQLIGSPLYLFNKDWYYAYMALTKQSFGLLATTMTQIWSPTIIRISGDESIKGQIRQTTDGRVECSFPDRIVLIANHQLYFDWLYLWWIGYTNTPSMHGHLYIILKETLKYIPIIGQGMMFYGFIFMSRKMQTDKPRLVHRLQKLKERHSGPLSGSQGLDPMWLLIFPEGTNASNNGRVRSAAWAEKIGVKDLKHQLLPRSTGSFFILNELKDTVEWVYDCTLAYEGVPRGQFGQDFFTLKTAYLEGRPPKSVNMYWRRIAVSSIPLRNEEEFSEWMLNQWRIKDDLMEEYVTTRRFPASPVLELNTRDASGKASRRSDGEYIETTVQQEHWWDFTKIWVPLGATAMVANILAKVWNVAVYGSAQGWKYPS